MSRLASSWHRGRLIRALVSAWLAPLFLVGCVDEEPEPDRFGRCAGFDPLRRPFFGDLHSHTGLSLDAHLQATRLRPEDAYRFARGHEIGIQPYDDEGEPLRRIRLDRPLDFAVVTDHAEFLGTVVTCSSTDAPGYDHPSCDTFRNDPIGAFLLINVLTASGPDEARYPDLCGPDGSLCLDAQREAWQEIRSTAGDAYDRTDECRFTTFVGYEWTSNPGTYNLHRNVIFRSDVVPDVPASYFDATTPERLWQALREGCIDAGTGCDALAIPHNSNLSGGLFFGETQSDGSPIDQAYAAEAEAMEPLFEVFQHKGSSECTLSPLAPDEQCSFEVVPYTALSGPVLGIRAEAPEQSFVRHALGLGLGFAQRLGASPYHFGFVGSTDTHLAAPGAVWDVGYPGHGGAGTSSAQGLPPGLVDVVEFNPGGLAVLWAEENSREALFLAMRRREAYATSGPRIELRFFGGFGLEGSLCDADDFAVRGYEQGVPMGGTLEPGGIAASAPTFAVLARSDPGSAQEPGALLERVQIVKGWLEGEDQRIEVHEIAGDPDLGAGADPSTCDPSSAGFETLCGTWTDPSFDSEVPAYYYARVLETPTCRWATRECGAAGVECDDPDTITEGYEGCCLDTWERMAQERAWSSPIWFLPE